MKGKMTESGWIVGFAGFFVMDVGLAAAAVLFVVINRSGTADGIIIAKFSKRDETKNTSLS